MQDIPLKLDEFNERKDKKSGINNTNFLTYGCVVSIVFDHNNSMPLQTLNYDSDKEKKKYRRIKSNIENNIVRGENNSINDSLVKNAKGIKESPKKRNDELDNFLGKSFIFSKGFFNKRLVLYQFSDILDTELNYKNTFFRIIPAGEYEFKNKLKQNIKTINTNVENKCSELKDLFSKFKQESSSNNENFKMNLEKKTPINFDDNIQFLHMQSGKFLKFKKKNDDTEVYLYLSKEPSTDTIFRIRPAFSYQIENATNLFFHLSICIACGNKASTHEMCLIRNVSTKQITDVQKPHHFENKKEDNFYKEPKLVDEEIRLKSAKVNEGEKKNSIVPFKNSGEFIICGHSNMNRWKFFNFSNNYVDDDLYLNNYDYFWIKNCEKDVYVIANEDEKTLKSINIEISSPYKQADKVEKFPIINKHSEKLIKEGDIFSFSYEFMKYIDFEKKLSLNVKYFDMNSHNSPFGLFVLEPVKKNFSKEAGYSIKLPPDIGPSHYKNFYKIRNVYSNTIICIDDSELKDHKELKLKLVPHDEVKNIEDCLFMVEQMYTVKNNTFENLDYRNNCVKKSDMMRFKSRKANSYIAIKQTDNKIELFLTRNLADLTIFKFDFISHEEKILVNFFYELNFILDLFIQKNIQFYIEENDYINKLNHIFKILEETLKYYKIEKVLFYSEDNHKIDVIYNLKEFSIVEKLLKLLFHIWFKRDLKDSHFEKEFIEDKLHEKGSNFDSKKKCTDKLLNLLTVIYDVDHSILYSIQNYLNYLFIFVGKVDSVTHFLIHIMRNNHSLMLKLLSDSKDNFELREVYDTRKKSENFQVKECIKNLFYLKEIKDDEKVNLFFDLLNVMLICNDLPFSSFYRETILQYEVIKIENGEVIPNLDLWFLGDFELDGDKIIFVKKMKENQDESKIYKYEINFTHNDLEENPHIISKNHFLILASRNIGLFSDLSLHDDMIREKLRRIFKIELITKYITNYDIKTYTCNKEINSFSHIKSSLIKMVDCLYLKQNENIIQNFKFCRIINNNKFPNFKENIDNWDNEVIEIKANVEKQIEKIINDQILDSPVTLQLIDTCHYILKYIYVREIKQKTYFDLNQKQTIFKFISLLLKVLEKLNSNTGYVSKNNKKVKNTVKDEGFDLFKLCRKKKVQQLEQDNHKEDNESLVLEFLQTLRNDTFGSLNVSDSPYLKIYENFKRKIMHTLILMGKKPEKNSKDGKIHNENYKDFNIQITKRICQIYLEFIRFIEFYMISQIEHNLIVISGTIPRIEKDDYIIQNDILTELIGFKDDKKPYLNILDEFAEFHSKNSLIKYSEKRDNSYLYSVSNIFFDCLQEENMDVKILIFDVIYRMNSQKLLFFKNISNLVILTEDQDCIFFEKTIELFAKINSEITKFNNYSLKDKSMKSSGINLQIYLKELLSLFEDIIKIDIKVQKIYNDDYKKLFPGATHIADQKDEKSTIISTNVEKAKYTQYILNNLNIIDIVICFMEKAKEITSSIINELESNDFLEEIQEILESVYTILYIFIYNNKKHKFMIEEDLEILLFPINYKKILNLNNSNINVRKSISKFILEYTREFEITELNNSSKFIDLIYGMITETDVKSDTSCIGYFIEILKIIITVSTTEIDEKISNCFDYLKKAVLDELNNLGFIERIYLRDILRLMIFMNKKISQDENENKLKFIMHLQEIFTIFDMLKKNDWKEIYFDIVNLAIDYLYLNRSFYKFELANNKKILRKLELILNHIEKMFPKSYIEELTYFKDFNRDENDEILQKINVNIFIGYSILKINHIIIEISQMESIRKPIKDALDNLLIVSNHLYITIESQFTEKSQILSNTFLYYIMNLNEMRDLTNKLSSHCKNIQDLLKNLKIEEKKENDSDKDNSIQIKPMEIVKKDNILTFWNNVKEQLNDPTIFDTKNFGKTKSNIFVKISDLINNERKKFVCSIIEFTNTTESHSSKENLKNKENRKNANYNYLIIKILNNVFVNIIDKHNKFKDKLHFYIWALIYFMKYNIENGELVEDSVQNMKNIISEIKFQNLIVKILRKKNLKCVDYSVSLLIKFLNVYLDGLEDSKKSHFLGFLINQSESEFIFILIKNVLEDLRVRISTKSSQEKDRKTTNTVNVILTKYETNINPYEQVTLLISTLLENNPIFKNQMKLYLRFQYNNSRSHNFISLISTILELFIDNVDEIENNYNIIITCIDSLTKCCSGPCPENQNSLVVDTKIINFASKFLFDVSYNSRSNRKDDNDSMIDFNIEFSGEIKVIKVKASFIKYKLVLLLLSLVEGRKKYDKIFSTISSKLKIENLMSKLLVETVMELLKEKRVQSLEDLRLSDDMYQRYKDPTKLNIEKFIIFEIGTFVFILINIFYDSLHENNKEDFFLKKISNLKKKLKNKQQSVKVKNFFLNFQSFGYKLLNSFKGIYSYILCKCIRDNTSKVNPTEDVTDESAYELYFTYTPYIEIVYKENIIKYYVRLYPMCQYLNDEMKEEFQENIDRTNTKSKLSYLFKSIFYIRDALEYRLMIEEIFQKIVFLDLFFNEYLFFKDISYILTIVINIVIIASYYRTSIANNNFTFSYALFYDPNTERHTQLTLQALTYTQIFLCVMIYINYLIKSLPKYTYQKDDTEKKKSFSNIRKIYSFIKRLCFDMEFVYNSFYLIMAILGLYLNNYFFFAAHLLEIVKRSETLINVINAIWFPKKQIIVTLILFMMVEYVFTIFVFLFYAKDANDSKSNGYCDYFIRCYLNVIDNTFKKPNGLMNFLNFEGYDKDFYLGGRFWLDNIFAIIVIMLILQMLAGIIVDNFSALRERQQIIAEDKYNICFICGLHKNKLNKLYSNEEGYNEHIKLDHYFWNYLFLIMNILKKEGKDLNEIDYEIYTNYLNQSFTWIPYERCEKLDEENNKKN